MAGFKSVVGEKAYADAYQAALRCSAIPVAERDISTPYGQTHVLSAGAEGAAPVVALHGKLMSSTMWVPHLSTLARNNRVFLVDVVGDLNKSRATKPLARKADAVRWLDSVLDGLGVERCVLLGMSYGGWLSAVYAMARPNRVTGVALLSPAGVFSRVRVGWMIRAMRATSAKSPRHKVEAFVGTMVVPSTAARLSTSPHREIFEQWHVGLPAFKLSTRERFPTRTRDSHLKQLTMPLLVIYGDQETVTDSAQASTRARRAVPHAQVELLAQANHSADIDQPERVQNLLGEFISKCSVAR